jgi:putative Mn2+ efflux pump MntP
MSFLELFVLAVGLSMDAFAVAIGTGLTMTNKVTVRKALTVGLYFGIFQAVMPVIGFFAARYFADMVMAYNHWVAFGLLGFLGGKMIYGSLKKITCPDRKCPEIICADRPCPVNQPPPEASLGYRQMLPLAVATSIDALAVGVTFAFLQVSIVPAVTLIGVTTLLLSMAGVKIGSVFGVRYKSKAELIGGVILILIGLRILLEHLHLFPF